MSNKIRNVEDLKGILLERWSKLDNIDSKYLSEAGVAAKEAYRAVIWHLAFHDDLASLKSDEEFMNLINISGKHPEYYRVLRMLNRALENIPV